MVNSAFITKERRLTSRDHSKVTVVKNIPDNDIIMIMLKK